jgi:catechol 2,3-dioxygenase-like lactoylglutathione lyase family enzyme
MDRIKHIAIFTADPEKTANFYVDVFGLEMAGPAGRGGFYLSDGEINLAILKARDVDADNPAGFQTPAGVDHFGFQVEDLEATQARLAEFGAEELPSHAPPGGGEFYYECRYRGAGGQVVDVTENGWVGTG